MGDGDVEEPGLGAYHWLFLCRTLLGLFEAGHFPCGLKTIQVLLAPRDRAMGCSLLQSGTALAPIVLYSETRYEVEPSRPL